MLRRIPAADFRAMHAPSVRELVGAHDDGVVRAVRNLDARKAALESLRVELTQRLSSGLGDLLRNQLVATDALDAVLTAELAKLRRAQSILVRIPPSDESKMTRAAELTERAELEGVLSFALDPSLTPGGCVLESSVGEIDARIETRVERLLAALLEGL